MIMAGSRRRVDGHGTRGRIIRQLLGLDCGMGVHRFYVVVVVFFGGGLLGQCFELGW